jgi:DNA-binding GntR family transcriptional regulator
MSFFISSPLTPRGGTKRLIFVIPPLGVRGLDYFFMKTPLYRQIQASLKEKITLGDYTEGSLLPSENDLCIHFNATRMTVRQALNELVKEGFIIRQHGKGSIVSAIRKSLGLLSLKGWTDVVGASERHGTTTILEALHQKKIQEPIFKHLLENEFHTDFIFLKRLRSVEEIPIMVEETYIPDESLIKITQEPLIDGSLFRTLYMRHQIDVNSMQQEIRAIVAEKEIANFLKIKTKTPILHILRKYGTSKEGFYLYSSIYCNTEKYAISSFN